MHFNLATTLALLYLTTSYAAASPIQQFQPDGQIHRRDFQNQLQARGRRGKEKEEANPKDESGPSWLSELEPVMKENRQKNLLEQDHGAIVTTFPAVPVSSSGRAKNQQAAKPEGKGSKKGIQESSQREQEGWGKKAPAHPDESHNDPSLQHEPDREDTDDVGSDTAPLVPKRTVKKKKSFWKKILPKGSGQDKKKDDK